MSNLETLTNQETISRKPKAFDKRVHEIDFARGFLILLVLIDHVLNRIMLDFRGIDGFLGNLSYFAEHYYWNTPFRTVMQPIALASFCLVSGISTAFSKNNWKRSLLLVAFAILIGFFSPIIGAFLGFGPIYFNVIGVLAASSLIYCFMQKRSYRIPLAFTLFSIIFTMYVITPIISDIYPQPWNPYLINESSFWLNICNPALIKVDPLVIVQSDYMPLFPYIAFFFVGVLISIFIYKDKKSHLPNLKADWERPICFMGRHSLWFYFGHQIVLLPLFYLIKIIVKG